MRYVMMAFYCTWAADMKVKIFIIFLNSGNKNRNKTARTHSLSSFSNIKIILNTYLD